MVDRHWGVNFDVEKLFLKPDFGVTVAGVKLTGKAELDPWLIGAGVTIVSDAKAKRLWPAELQEGRPRAPFFVAACQALISVFSACLRPAS